MALHTRDPVFPPSIPTGKDNAVQGNHTVGKEMIQRVWLRFEKKKYNMMTSGKTSGTYSFLTVQFGDA